jgi:outer membrane protein TolC
LSLHKRPWPRRRKAFASPKIAFTAGLSTVTDLLRIETALLETQTRYSPAVHDQRIAAAMWEFAAGTLGPDSEVLN